MIRSLIHIMQRQQPATRITITHERRDARFAAADMVADIPRRALDGKPLVSCFADRAEPAPLTAAVLRAHAARP